jgi:type II secretory pathway pseudopilin PulG
MAVLLVAISLMAVMMTVAMPVWKQVSQREKEAELVFRGMQYARAIELMQRKMPGAFPPNIDLLVTQKFLRKKYKDPITGDDFDTVAPAQTIGAGGVAGSQQPGQPTGLGGAGRGGAGRGGAGPAGPGRSNTPPTQPATPGAARPGIVGGTQGGIIGVVSKSKDASIRLYNGRGHYNEWIFQAIQRTPTPGGATGAPTPGQPTPGGPGRGQPPGGGRGGPGMPPPPGGRGPGFPPPPGRP